MSVAQRAAALALVIAVSVAAAPADAQTYPTRPVKLMTTEAGALPDILSRLLVHEMGGALGQPMVVENKVNQILAGELAGARPDGYTLALGSGFLWITSLVEKTPYDPLSDFAPVTLAGKYPLVLVANPAAPVKSIADLVSYAKANPGKLNFAVSATAGSEATLGAGLIRALAKIDFTAVPYRGTAQSMIAVLSNEAQLSFTSPAAAAGPVQDGKLRALAVTSLTPSALAPGLPTVAEGGLPGYQVELLVGVIAPSGTPPDIIAKLNGAFLTVLNKPGMKDRLIGLGVETIGSTPAEFGARIRSEMNKWDAIIKGSLKTN